MPPKGSKTPTSPSPPGVGPWVLLTIEVDNGSLIWVREPNEQTLDVDTHTQLLPATTAQHTLYSLSAVLCTGWRGYQLNRGPAQHMYPLLAQRSR
jgi:hypothetical protein